MWEFLGRVITGDETWVFQYDPETKRQSLQLKTQNSPRAKKSHISKSKIKVMLIAFFDQRGVVHEFGPQGQTVNQQFYQWLLNSPNDWVRRSRWALWRDKSWLLHHDIPTHTPFTVRQFSQQTDHSSRPPSLYRTVWFLGLPKDEDCAQRNPFSLSRTDQGHSDEGAEGPQRGFCNRTFVIKPFWENSRFFIVTPHEVKYYF